MRTTDNILPFFLGYAAAKAMDYVFDQSIAYPNFLNDQTNVETTSTSASAFDSIVSKAYKTAFDENIQPARQDFASFVRPESNGGLQVEDLRMLSQFFSSTSSLFEYGLGESTYLASHLGVPRYSGIDSDAVWVSLARDKSQPHFRFYLGDIGPTKGLGVPVAGVLPKAVLNYQLAPLIVEPEAFQIYFVDGRFRLACMLACFLHASARGAPPEETVVLIHDCFESAEALPELETFRANYNKADHLLDLVKHSGKRLCAYKRKKDTTDEQLLGLWNEYHAVVQR
jgi:hypothetical protein